MPFTTPLPDTELTPESRVPRAPPLAMQDAPLYPSAPAPAGYSSPQAPLAEQASPSPSFGAASTTTAPSVSPTAPPADAGSKAGRWALALLGGGGGYVQGATAKAAIDAQRASTQINLERHQFDQRQREQKEQKESLLQALKFAEDPTLGKLAIDNPAVQRYLREDLPPGSLPPGWTFKFQKEETGYRLMAGPPDGTAWQSIDTLPGLRGAPALVQNEFIERLQFEVDPTYQAKRTAEQGAQMQQRLMGQLEELNRQKLANQIDDATFEAQARPLRQQLATLNLQRETIGAAGRRARAPMEESTADIAAEGQQVLTRRQTAEQYHQETLETGVLPTLKGFDQQTQGALAPWVQVLQQAMKERPTAGAGFSDDAQADLTAQLAQLDTDQGRRVLPVLQQMENNLAESKRDGLLLEKIQGGRRLLERKALAQQFDTLGTKQLLETEALGGAKTAAEKSVIFNAYTAGLQNPGLGLAAAHNSSILRFDGKAKPAKLDMAYGEKGSFMAFLGKDGQPLKINGEDAKFSKEALQRLIPSEWTRLSDYAIFNKGTGQIHYTDGAMGNDPDLVDKQIKNIRDHLQKRYNLRWDGLNGKYLGDPADALLASVGESLAFKLLRDGVFSNPSAAASTVANAADAYKADRAQEKKPLDPGALEPFFYKWAVQNITPSGPAARGARAPAAGGAAGTGAPSAAVSQATDAFMATLAPPGTAQAGPPSGPRIPPVNGPRKELTLREKPLQEFDLR